MRLFVLTFLSALSFLISFAAESACFQSNSRASWEIRQDDSWRPLILNGTEVLWNFPEPAKPANKISHWSLTVFLSQTVESSHRMQISMQRRLKNGGRKEMASPFVSKFNFFCMDSHQSPTDCNVIDGGIFSMESSASGGGNPSVVEDPKDVFRGIQQLKFATAGGFFFDMREPSEIRLSSALEDAPAILRALPKGVTVSPEDLRVAITLSRVEEKLCSDIFSAQQKETMKAKPENNRQVHRGSSGADAPRIPSSSPNSKK